MRKLKQGDRLSFLLNVACRMARIQPHTKGYLQDGDRHRIREQSGTLHHPAHRIPGLHAGTAAAAACLALGGELQGLLSAADRSLSRLDGSVLTLPNPDLFVFMYMRKEAHRRRRCTELH
jgi:Fic/DOC family N-terminal